MQSREHLFKECITWKKDSKKQERLRVAGPEKADWLKDRGRQERAEKDLGRAVAGPVNTAVRDLLSDERFTGVGKAKEGALISGWNVDRPTLSFLPSFPFISFLVLSHALGFDTAL